MNRSMCVGMLAVLLMLSGCASKKPGILSMVEGIPYPIQEQPAAETIIHVPTGLEVNREALFQILPSARVVFVGEAHDSVNSHRVQLEVIQAMEAAHPGQVAIAMEMFREPQQPALDRWTRGEFDELTFLKQSNWYGNWRQDFAYYRAILEFAKEKGLDVVALNPSKEVQKEVSRVGLANVGPEVRKTLPEIAEMDPYQRVILDGLFAGHASTEDQLRAMYEVQLLWEESMANNIVTYLKSPRGQGKHLVALAGGWHVQYGFGLPKKVMRRMPLSYLVVLPEDITDKAHFEAHPERRMDVELTQIPLYIADYLWFVDFVALVSDLPKLGVWVNDQDGPVLVKMVAEGSAAAKVGILKGDEVLEFDGQSIVHDEDVSLYMSQKKFGEKVVLKVRREGKELIFTATLTRPNPAP